MNIEIRKLTPQLAEEYVRFFEVTPHNGCTSDDPCYCVTWRSDDTYDEPHWFSSREKRRERALTYVKNGSLQGYLAYCGDQIVGWCNANADCQNCIGYLRSFFPIEEHHEDADEAVKIKSIFCFLIAPDWQRKGIATKLIERVCQDAAHDGFDFVEAYVNQNFVSTADDFRGPAEMYKKSGFYVHAEQDGRAVMRKALK